MLTVLVYNYCYFYRCHFFRLPFLSLPFLPVAFFTVAIFTGCHFYRCLFYLHPIWRDINTLIFLNILFLFAHFTKNFLLRQVMQDFLFGIQYYYFRVISFIIMTIGKSNPLLYHANTFYFGMPNNADEYSHLYELF